MRKRKAITLVVPNQEDCAITILKPFSDEHKDKMIVIFEDAYGEIKNHTCGANELKLRFKLTDEQIKTILENI
jgi:hypothetical protein